MPQVVAAGLEAASGTGGWHITLVGGSRRQQRPQGEPQPAGRQHHDAGGWAGGRGAGGGWLQNAGKGLVEGVAAQQLSRSCRLTGVSACAHLPPPADFVVSHASHPGGADLLGRLAGLLLEQRRIVPRERGAFFALQVGGRWGPWAAGRLALQARAPSGCWGLSAAGAGAGAGAGAAAAHACWRRALTSRAHQCRACTDKSHGPLSGSVDVKVVMMWPMHPRQEKRMKNVKPALAADLRRSAEGRLTQGGLESDRWGAWGAPQAGGLPAVLGMQTPLRSHRATKRCLLHPTLLHPPTPHCQAGPPALPLPLRSARPCRPSTPALHRRTPPPGWTTCSACL